MAQSGTEKRNKLGKDHQDYWASKLKKRSYKWKGQICTIPEWQVRIAHLGKREWFNTGTPNRTAAAAKAKEIYQFLKVSGWEPTLQKHKPGQIISSKCATVGEYLDAVKTNSSLRQVTFEIYAKKFRTLVAGVFGVKGGKERYDYVNGGRKKWLDKINRIRLHRITDKKVEAWKNKYLKKAENDNPLAYKQARTTLNSLIRAAKSLFTDDIIKQANVTLPLPYPLSGVANVPVMRSRYKSGINATALTVAAKNELQAAKPECFKIYLLAFAAGLRRDEIDTLTWEQIDWEDNTICIETTVYTGAKTETSEAEVDVDPAFLKLLKAYMQPGAGEFVIHSENKPRLQHTASYHYRCEKHFNELIKWLRSKGVKANNPLHTLRKEFGSQIAAQAGIFAASTALRHADIQLTRDHYVDKKTPTFLSISKILHPEIQPPEKLPQAEQAQP